MTELTITSDNSAEFYITMVQESGSANVVLRDRHGWWSLCKPFKKNIALGPSESLHWTEALKRALALLEEPT